MQEEKQRITVLYVDDEINALNSFKASFKKYYDIHLAQSAEEAIELMNEITVQIIIADQRMPGTTGTQFLESIVRKFPDPVRILITGFTDVDALKDGINKAQIYHYLEKPWNQEGLKIKIDEAHKIYSLRLNSKIALIKFEKENKILEFYLSQKIIS